MTAATRPRIALLVALAAVATALGVAARFHGISSSALAIDEYYLTQSILYILERGLPAFPGGGYYTRGLLLQYLAAPVLYLAPEPELYLRLGTAIASLFVLGAVYMLAQRIGGTPVACLALILCSLSVWQIEFARFARMYAPFAAVFLFTVYFACRVAIEQADHLWKWAYVLAGTSIFVYEGAIFAVLAAMLPLAIRNDELTLRRFLVPAGLVILAAIWQFTDFRFLGDAPVAGSRTDPSGLTVIGPLTVGPLLAPTLLTISGWGIGFLLLCAAFATSSVVTIRALFSSPLTSGSLALAGTLVLIATLALLNYLLLATALLACYALIRIAQRDPAPALNWLKPAVITTILLLAASAVFWAAYVAISDDWRGALDIESRNTLRNLRVLLFGYPDVQTKLLRPWLAAMPIGTLALGAFIALSGVLVLLPRALDDQQRRGVAFLLFAIALCLLLMGVFRQPFVSTRYTYFLHPLLLLLVASSAWHIGSLLASWTMARRAIAVAVLIAVMIASEDYSARHIWNISSEKVMYRTDMPPGRAEQYYPRWDFRGPAEYVNRHAEPDDIIISSQYSVPYYLDRLDYMYVDRSEAKYRGIATDGGERELWTGRPLLSSTEELKAVMETTDRTVWIIAASEDYQWANPGESVLAVEYSSTIRATSSDARLNVYAIESGDQTE